MDGVVGVGFRAPKAGSPHSCSVCSSWTVAVAATYRGHKPYLVACPFDPHRPYQKIKQGFSGFIPLETWRLFQAGAALRTQWPDLCGPTASSSAAGTTASSKS